MTVKKIEIGDVFPTNQGCMATVVEYVNARKVLIEFNDEYKHQRYVYASHLRAGKARNPFHKSFLAFGCHGVGIYKKDIGGKVTEEYQAWRNMLTRCYDPSYLNKAPTYIDCYVCDEWLNFQKFAEWYTANEFYGAGYQLDKDLLVQGNKIYSPKTCLLIPQKLNKALIENTTLSRDYPTGVCYDKSKRSFAAQITMHGKHKLIGRFKTPELAESAYISTKDAYVKDLAVEFKGSIDDRLFIVLMNWTASNRR